MATAPTTPTATPADPAVNPGLFLQQAGWKPLGLPDHPMTLWLDGSRPAEGFWTEYTLKTVDNSGHEIDLLGQTGKGRSAMAPVKRKQYTPPAEPMSQTEAILEQMRRNRAALSAAAKK